MKEIQLTQGKTSKVSDEDYEELNKHKWHAFKNGKHWYARRQITVAPKKQAHICIHQVLCGKGADHIDGDGLNNQRDNLRPATSQQNCFNRKPLTGCTSPHKGVSWHKYNKKWGARIKRSGKSFFLGYFDNEDDAALAYKSAAIVMFGLYAHNS